jgi:glycosyltransferase involved in cell wall biosynthesis
MHVASGGFSGATQVALDLTLGGLAHHDTLLVLRRKRRTPQARVQALLDQRVPLELIPGWSHWASIRALRDLCRRWKPDIVVGHGFPEHLIARWAAGAAGVPVRVQVEHNMRERYTAFKRWQVAQLAPDTQAFIGVSDAVSGVLGRMGLPPKRVRTIRNGTALQAFEASESRPLGQREAAILMAARFGNQKDQATLIRSLVPLAQVHGLRPKLRLAGGGSQRHQKQAEQLVQSLGLEQQVEFLGHRSDVPALLMGHRIAALSTHYEGLPLSLAEAMAAGCAVVGSDVAAVRETLGDGQWGLLAKAGDPRAWADALATLLLDDAGTEARANAARAHARVALSRQRMVDDYAELFEALAGRQRLVDQPSASVACSTPTRPWLSVLVPAYNAGPYLEEALQSILSQLDAHAELIVVNDASTDSTADVLARWAPDGAGSAAARHNRGPTVRVIHHPSGLGVSGARNALLDAAQGSWLWFLDADDRLRPGAVAQLREVLTQLPDLQAVVVDHAVLRSKPRLKHRLRGESHRRSLPFAPGAIAPGAALMQGLMACGQWHVWGKVVRADAWPTELRFPVGRVFEDLSLVPRLMSGIDRAWYLCEPLIDYRSNPGSILGSMNAAKLKDWAQALDDLTQAPGFNSDWADFVAQQAVRMARVARHLGQHDGLNNWTPWWQGLCARQPAVLKAMRSWAWRPNRWAAWLQAWRLGALHQVKAKADAPPAPGGTA